MSTVIGGVSPNGVHIAGGFQGWDPSTTELLDTDNDLVFETTVAFDTTGMNGVVEYKYINGNDWSNTENPSGFCATDWGNRFIDLSALDSNLLVTGNADGNPQCFDSCDACAAPQEPVWVTFNVDMSSQAAISPNGVCIAGNFNGWNAGLDMLSDADGDLVYTTTLAIPPGEYEYKFINGTYWGGIYPGDIDNELIYGACAAQGNDNRFLWVEGETMEVTWCYNTCDANCAGCTDSNACNYNPNVDADNGSCDYESCVGCLDEDACNFWPGATIADESSCTYPMPNHNCNGVCIDENACNYDATTNSVVYSEDFEGFASTDLVTATGEWTTWSGNIPSDEEANIFQGFAHSGGQSVRLDPGTDIFLPLGLGSGIVTCSFHMAASSNTGGWWNVQGTTSPGDSWSLSSHVNSGFNDIQVSSGNGHIPFDEFVWTEVTLYMQLDYEQGVHYATIFIDGNYEGNVNMPSGFGGVNFGAYNGEWFMDDLVIEHQPWQVVADCTYPGCDDPEASNYNPVAGCDGECVYFNCNSVGTPFWEAQDLGLYPAWQSAMHGVEWSGEWVLNTSATVVDAASGIQYPVHHVEWNSPTFSADWLEGLELNADASDPSSQLCLTAYGLPPTPGLEQVTVEGEVFISVFGNPFSIGSQTFTSTIEVLVNPDPIFGCTYPLASNYFVAANLDNGSCIFPGCTDATAVNFTPLANEDDGSCLPECTQTSSCTADNNHDGTVNVSDLLGLLSEFGFDCE